MINTNFSNIKLLIPLTTIFIAIYIAINPVSLNAQTGIDQLQQNLDTFGQKTGLGASSDSDIKNSIANIINIALGFLGILAVIIILFAGFKWMTAGGNEEQVTQSKKTLRNAIIGLVIIFLSFAITNFAISQLQNASSGVSSNGSSIIGPKSCFYKVPGEDCATACMDRDGGESCPEYTSYSACHATKDAELIDQVEGPCSETCSGCPEAGY